MGRRAADDRAIRPRHPATPPAAPQVARQLGVALAGAVLLSRRERSAPRVAEHRSEPVPPP